MFGSSRAIHHYNPLIIEDSLGMSCYNCGQDGNGAILNYGRYQMICQRYAPKILVYDVQESFDIYKGENNDKYLGWLRAYYDREGIEEIFNSVDENEKYKMLSHLYQYNSKFLGIVTDFMHPMKSVGIKGFRPLEGEMDMMKIKEESPVLQDVDTLKVYYLEKLINKSKETKVVVVASPSWNAKDAKLLEPIKNICKAYGIPFLDYSNDGKYVRHNEFFKDGGHLNEKGANEFTKDFVKELKRYI